MTRAIYTAAKDGKVYHVRGCPILPGKETVTLDYIEQ